MRIIRSTHETPDRSDTDRRLRVEEERVIWMMNRAMAMLAVPYDEGMTAMVPAPDGVEPNDHQPYQDAIADLLQAADHAGIDTQQLCVAAKMQQRVLREQADDARRRRQRREQSEAERAQAERPLPCHLEESGG